MGEKRHHMSTGVQNVEAVNVNPADLLDSIAAALHLPLSFFETADDPAGQGNRTPEGRAELQGLIGEIEGAGDLPEFMFLARAFVELSRRRRVSDVS